MQLIPNDDGTISLAVSGVPQAQANVDEQKIEQLVAQLSDPDQRARDPLRDPEAAALPTGEGGDPKTTW